MPEVPSPVTCVTEVSSSIDCGVAPPTPCTRISVTPSSGTVRGRSRSPSATVRPGARNSWSDTTAEHGRTLRAIVLSRPVCPLVHGVDTPSRAAEDFAALCTGGGENRGAGVAMTFFFPDIASYQAGMKLDGLAVVSVKATEGTSYVNPDYARVVRDAGQLRIPVISYHFLRHGNAAAQAAHASAVVGAGKPLMLDVETA